MLNGLKILMQINIILDVVLDLLLIQFFSYPGFGVKMIPIGVENSSSVHAGNEFKKYFKRLFS